MHEVYPQRLFLCYSTLDHPKTFLFPDLYMLGDVRNLWYPKEEILFHAEFP